MKPAEDKILKLPKWAQEYIQTLERQEVRLEQKVAAVYDTNPDETNVFIEDGMKDHPLPRHSTMVFKMSDINKRQHPRDDIRVRIDRDGNLEIMGGDTIAVYPCGSNLVRVRLVQ